MLFLSMAETIRRAMEHALGRELPEEDELGFGCWVEGARRLLYGTDRVLDAPEITRRQFLSDAGIDYGTKVRCYVEGDTEYGALGTVVGQIGGIELVNLRGQFLEKRGKGLVFRDSLLRDIKMGVFSFIMVDADNNDIVRAVRKAANDDDICGRVFISSPDFELGNFTVSELCLVLMGLAERVGAARPSQECLFMTTRKASSGKEFFSLVASKFPGLASQKKSEAWGKALMDYATTVPYLREDMKRPVIDAAELIVWARTLKYQITRDRLKVDSKTGDLVARN